MSLLSSAFGPTIDIHAPTGTRFGTGTETGLFNCLPKTESENYCGSEFERDESTARMAITRTRQDGARQAGTTPCEIWPRLGGTERRASDSEHWGFGAIRVRVVFGGHVLRAQEFAGRSLLFSGATSSTSIGPGPFGHPATSTWFPIVLVFSQPISILVRHGSCHGLRGAARGPGNWATEMPN